MVGWVGGPAVILWSSYSIQKFAFICQIAKVSGCLKILHKSAKLIFCLSYYALW
jgi:hypothetical protein